MAKPKTGAAVVAELDSELEKTLSTMMIEGKPLTDSQKDAIRKASKAESRSRRMNEEEILKKRPHAIPGTLRFDAAMNKQVMDIECQFMVDGKKHGVRRVVATSDLHQVTTCTDCKDASRKVKKDEEKALLAKFKKEQEAKKAEVITA